MQLQWGRSAHSFRAAKASQRATPHPRPSWGRRARSSRAAKANKRPTPHNGARRGRRAYSVRAAKAVGRTTPRRGTTSRVNAVNPQHRAVRLQVGDRFPHSVPAYATLAAEWSTVASVSATSLSTSPARPHPSRSASLPDAQASPEVLRSHAPLMVSPNASVADVIEHGADDQGPRATITQVEAADVAEAVRAYF